MTAFGESEPIVPTADGMREAQTGRVAIGTFDDCGAQEKFWRPLHCALLARWYARKHTPQAKPTSTDAWQSIKAVLNPTFAIASGKLATNVSS